MLDNELLSVLSYLRLRKSGVVVEPFSKKSRYLIMGCVDYFIREMVKHKDCFPRSFTDCDLDFLNYVIEWRRLKGRLWDFKGVVVLAEGTLDGLSELDYLYRKSTLFTYGDTTIEE